jgi:hypothetical protein
VQQLAKLLHHLHISNRLKLETENTALNVAIRFLTCEEDIWRYKFSNLRGLIIEERYVDPFSLHFDVPLQPMHLVIQKL